MAGRLIWELRDVFEWDESQTYYYTYILERPLYYDENDPNYVGVESFLEEPYRTPLTEYAIQHLERLTNLNLEFKAHEHIELEDGSVQEIIGDFTFGFADGTALKQVIPDVYGWNPEEGAQSSNKNEFTGDVWLVNGGYADMGNELQFLQALIHEFGHALGLKHAGEFEGPNTPMPWLPFDEDNNQFTAMSYAVHPTLGTHAISFQLYDIALLQYLYGADTGTEAGDTSYTYSMLFPVGLAPYCLWDGGGTDTLSAEGTSAGAIIDLREGRFSSITNEPTYYDDEKSADNLSIAFGCTIENAKGSDQADLIIGNSLDKEASRVRVDIRATLSRIKTAPPCERGRLHRSSV